MMRIVLADKDRLVMQLLARLINEEPDMRVESMCTGGEELRRALASGRFDVAVVDPAGLDPLGAEMLTRVQECAPGVRIVVVTASTRESDLFAAVRAGVRGYITKSTDVSEVLTAIRAAHCGNAVLCQEQAAQLMDAFARQSVHDTGLSPRQREILEGLVQGKTNREIAADLALSEKTVKNYMRSVFSVLGCRDRTEAAVVGIRRGLVSVA
jgi:two-component system NarL family response regulator